MKIPQPFQYQGSKRILAATILQYLPLKFERLVEPFAGSAAMSLACASKARAKKFWINDFNEPLSLLLDLIINNPEMAAQKYENIWRGDSVLALEQFYSIRDQFNSTQDPSLLLYLLARCVKGSVRYNSEGLFNQSPDKRRLGTKPETMRSNISSVSALLRKKTQISSLDYRDVLKKCGKSDVVYMDPPYQGVCGERDSRYFSGIDFDGFVEALEMLNSQGVRYLISYDGRLGDRSYGKPLPEHLNLTLVEIEVGRSSQATLLGRSDITIESLYISNNLAREVGLLKGTAYSITSSQLQFLEPVREYA